MLTRNKVAIVHDWLVGYRGGERVLEALCELYPQAEIFTLFYKKGAVSESIESHPIHESILSRLPFSSRYYRYLLPFLPATIEQIDLSDFDLVLSSSHCVAKGVITRPETLHVCYCHSPMRYVWDLQNQYFPKGLIRFLAPVLHYLRMWDTLSHTRVDQFISNSDFVGRRIAKFYGRESETIYPFVDLETFVPKSVPRDYYLVVSALAPYKRIELAIEACNRLERKLVVVGSGPREKSLRRLGGKTVRFVDEANPSKLREYYQGCKALLFPGIEDFGITPLEAMACGRPVLAYGAGGVLETVIDGKTGLFFEEQTVESLEDVMQSFEKNFSRFLPEDCRRRAEKFTKDRFKKGIVSLVNRTTEVPRGDLPASELPESPLFQ